MGVLYLLEATSAAPATVSWKGQNFKGGGQGSSHLNSSVQSLGFGLMSWEAGVDSWLLTMCVHAPVCLCVFACSCVRSFPTTKPLCARMQVLFARLLWQCSDTQTHTFSSLWSLSSTGDSVHTHTHTHAQTVKAQRFAKLKQTGFLLRSNTHSVTVATETGQSWLF